MGQAASFLLLVVELNFGLRHQQQPLGMPQVASLFLCPFLVRALSSLKLKISCYILT